MIKESINIENIDGQLFEIKIIEPEDSKPASFTHYLYNHKNGVSQFYKKDALAFVKEILEKEYPTEKITNKVAENALQYLIFDFKKTIPFPAPERPKFKFIDLFAGIGGFRLALQNLNGKCVFTSEWDKYSKQTYKANFGEIPFGDITKAETKNYIPDNFDVLCAGFPCQAFSIAGRRGGFEDTRGTLFFDVAEIIKNKRPKAIFLENVKGLRNHDKGKTLATILNVLREDLNYYVPEPQILNAKEFGVPQNRERIFIVGFRKDLGINNLGVSLSGRAFRSNFFARISQKRFLLQSLTQNAA
jgi:DNA (cytosine-5)-methyltransferase 1